MTENDITIAGHGSATPSLKNMKAYLTSRYNSKASNGVHKGLVAVMRLKALTDSKRVEFFQKYSIIIGRNTYNQSLRQYVYTSLNGKYYSDCSSSIMATFKEIGYNVGLLNTAGIYTSSAFEKVDANIVAGHVTNPEILKVGDVLLFAGNDATRPLQIGHCEVVMKTNSQQIDDTTDYIYGVDLSSYNTINSYKALKNEGIHFAVLRSITKNLKTDSSWEKHLRGCDSVGIDVSTYVYSYAETINQAQSEAKALLGLLGTRKMQIWYDVESQEQLRKLGKVGMQNIIDAFAKVCTDAGYPVGIYTGYSFAKMLDADFLKKYSLWIARYGKNDGILNESYKPNMGEIAWQYSSAVKISLACSGNLDGDVLYKTTSATKESTLFDKIFGSVLGTNGNAMVPSELLGRVNATMLNRRTSTDTSSATNIVGTYQMGDFVNVVKESKNGAWFMDADGRYVSAKYIKPCNGTVTNCSTLNVRSGPSNSWEILFQVSAGKTGQLLSKSDAFYKIKFADGSQGFVHENYIKVN